MGTHYTGPPDRTRALDAYVKLARCTDVLEAHLKARLAETGMTLPQLGVLEALLHLGPLSQKELCSKMLRTAGSMTALVDHLEHKGWVRRQRSAQDRRVCIASLTAAGRREIERVFPGHARDVAEAFGVLTASEQRRLAGLCRKLGRALAERLEHPRT